MTRRICLHLVEPNDHFIYSYCMYIYIEVFCGFFHEKVVICEQVSGYVKIHTETLNLFDAGSAW